MNHLKTLTIYNFPRCVVVSKSRRAVDLSVEEYEQKLMEGEAPLERPVNSVQHLQMRNR